MRGEKFVSIETKGDECMLFGFKQTLKYCNEFLRKEDHQFSSQYIMLWKLITIIFEERTLKLILNWRRHENLKN